MEEKKATSQEIVTFIVKAINEIDKLRKKYWNNLEIEFLERNDESINVDITMTLGNKKYEDRIYISLEDGILNSEEFLDDLEKLKEKAKIMLS